MRHMRSELKHPKSGIDTPQCLAAKQRFPRLGFFVHLLSRAHQDVVFHELRHNDNTVKIGENELTGMDELYDLKTDPFDPRSQATLRVIETFLRNELPRTVLPPGGVKAEWSGVTVNARDLAEVAEADRVRVNFFILAGISAIGPTVDAFSMLFQWVALCLLYELGIWLCIWSPKKAPLDIDVPDSHEMIEV